MKNKDIAQLSQGLQSCGNLKGIKLAYAIAKNNRILTRELEPLSDIIKKLQEEYCKKDVDGKPIITNNQYEIDNVIKFNEEYNNLLNMDIDITLHRIKREDLPDDITVQQLSSILDFVDEQI